MSIPYELDKPAAPAASGAVSGWQVVAQSGIKKEIERDQEHERLVRLGREIVESSPQLFIDVDVEGDGPAGYGSLLSIGAVAPDGERFYCELKPQTSEYNEGARRFCEEHGLQRERLINEGLPIEEAVRDFVEWTLAQQQKHGKQPVFTAFNAGYDWAHCDLAIARAGYDRNPYGVAPFDIKSLAMILAATPDGESGEWDWERTRKSSLPRVISPSREFTHNALEDAIYQQEQHFALVGLLHSADNSRD